METIAKKSVHELHEEHLAWMNELQFAEDELGIYQKRLEELVGKRQDREMMPELEHFQNRFVRQQEVINDLKHRLRRHEHRITTLLQAAGSKDPDEVFAADHYQLREDMGQFRKLFQELKKDFYRFLAKWKV